MEAGNFRCVLNVTQIQRREPMDVNTTLRLLTSENIRMSNDLRQESAVFEARFSRCHEMLHFLACRVLGSPERAHDVVENCRITASQNPPTFEYEGNCSPEGGDLQEFLREPRDLFWNLPLESPLGVKLHYRQVY